MHGRLGDGIDAGMQMEEMGVDRRGCIPGEGIDARGAVVCRRPDGHAASLPGSAREIALEARALPQAALCIRQSAFGGEQPSADCLEPIERDPSRQNIGREGRDIAQRPGEQRRDNLLRHAWGAVLAHMPISGDARSRLPGPRLEPETASRQVIPEMVEIGDHLQELADDDGAPR